MFENHRSEKYTTRFPMYQYDTWRLMPVFFLSLAWSTVSKKHILFIGKSYPADPLPTAYTVRRSLITGTC